jgi:hypothetical protein
MTVLLIVLVSVVASALIMLIPVFFDIASNTLLLLMYIVGLPIFFIVLLSYIWSRTGQARKARQDILAHPTPGVTFEAGVLYRPIVAKDQKLRRVSTGRLYVKNNRLTLQDISGKIIVANEVKDSSVQINGVANDLKYTLKVKGNKYAIFSFLDRPLQTHEALKQSLGL